ncbi:MAG: hypothetical protein IPM82_32000 [Saprospiraceae bacterium]|nr:hypothetical protein [Saprospiraceae bacterium]
MPNTTHSRPKKAVLANSALEEVKVLLSERLPEHIYFHNENYLEQMLEAAKLLTEEAALDKTEAEALQLATIFHVVGYLDGNKKYWQKSSKVANEFLLRNKADIEIVGLVEKLILALDPKQKPDTLLEKLFLDAQNSYYGDKTFLERIDRLKKEEEAFSKEDTDEIEWTNVMLERVKDHAFHSSQAESLFGKRKEKNIKKLKKSLQSSLKVKLEGDKSSSISANSGARTMFKTALRNHIDLTNIADQKANIMLSINALIITIGLPAFATYLTGTSYLILPGVIFLLTSVATMIIATISTRPIKVTGETDLTQLKSGKTNLFFFGNYYRIPNEEYQTAIKEIVADRENLDASFVNDLYYLGTSLGEKFRLLRLCYNVFVVGLCLSLLSFLVAYLISIVH